MFLARAALYINKPRHPWISAFSLKSLGRRVSGQLVKVHIPRSLSCSDSAGTGGPGICIWIGRPDSSWRPCLETEPGKFTSQAESWGPILCKPMAYRSLFCLYFHNRDVLAVLACAPTQAQGEMSTCLVLVVWQEEGISTVHKEHDVGGSTHTWALQESAWPRQSPRESGGDIRGSGSRGGAPRLWLWVQKIKNRENCQGTKVLRQWDICLENSRQVCTIAKKCKRQACVCACLHTRVNWRS